MELLYYKRKGTQKKYFARTYVLLKRPNSNYLGTIHIQEEAERTLLYIHTLQMLEFYTIL